MGRTPLLFNNTSTSMASSVQEALANANNDPAVCTALLSELVASGDEQGLTAFIDYMVSEDRPPVVRINLVTAFANTISTSPSLDTHSAIANHAYTRLNNQDSFVDQLGKICQDMADRFQDAEQFKNVALWRGRVPLDRMSPSDRFVLNAKIAQVHLEIGDAMAARAYINRALKDQSSCTETQWLTLYDVCRARVLDLTGEFLNAYKLYYDLSCRELIPEEKRHCLTASVVCAVLAKAGPRRSRALALIYKDERARDVECFPILEKMYLRRILRPEEIESFTSLLQPHHVALGPDGSTILERAVREHNVQAVAAIYSNISFSELGAILDIDAELAEEIVSSLIIRGSLSGTIDQSTSVVAFTESSALSAFDSSIASLCNHVSAIMAPLAVKYPDFVSTE